MKSEFTFGLLHADTVEHIAELARGYAGSVFAAQALCLVWRLSSIDSSAALQRHPAVPLDRGQLDLIAAAMESGGEVRATLAQTAIIRMASALEGRHARGRAVLVSEWADQGPPVDSAAWQEFIALVAVRVESVLAIADRGVTIRGLEKTARLQGALYAITDLASSSLQMPEMLRQLHSIVGQLMYAENFYIALYHQDRDTLRFIYFVDSHDPRVVDPEEEFPAARMQGSLTLAVLRSGRPAMGPTTRLRAEFDIPVEPIYGPDSADWLGVPMVADGEMRGAVVVQSYDQERRYSDEDRDLLTFVAKHILTALLRKQAHEELELKVQQRTRDLTAEVIERQRGEKLQAALYAIADLASGDLAMSDMLARVHGVVGELMYAENFYIALYNAERDTLRFIYFADLTDLRTPDPTLDLPAERIRSSITLGLIRHGKPVKGSAREVAAQLAVPGGLGLGTPADDFLGVPMVANGDVRGAVVVQSYARSERYTDEDSALLSYVAQHILTALERKQAQEELERRVQDRTRELADAVNELRELIGQRERIQQQLLHETLHDALTGLPNRTFLLQALERAVLRLRQDPQRTFAVLFLDLDRFKVVNDSVGHWVGDQMLKQAAARLQSCAPGRSVVARLGGDEFALLLEEIHSAQDAVYVAQQAIDAFGESMHVGGKELYTSVSIGIALSNERYTNAEELLRDADVAMYKAKACGRKRFELFDEELHHRALKLLDLEGDLRRAVQNAEFEPHFQPIVRLHDRHIIGFEALLRWRHPSRGLLLPRDFLEVAEDNGSVEQIDWLMFERTLRGISPLLGEENYVTLNVSARHFHSPEFAQRMLSLLASHAVATRWVRLEVTEGVLLDNPDQVRSTLEALRSAGVLAMLDDFGTGYSSLSYLHSFPLNALKIDRSFATSLAESRGTGAVVRAVLALATTLELEVVVEGIEMESQREQLLDLGCKFGQGFLFGRPMPLEHWLGLKDEVG